MMSVEMPRMTPHAHLRLTCHHSKHAVWQVAQSGWGSSSGGLQRALTHMRDLLSAHTSEDAQSHLLNSVTAEGEVVTSHKVFIIQGRQKDWNGTLTMLLSCALSQIGLVDLFGIMGGDEDDSKGGESDILKLLDMEGVPVLAPGQSAPLHALFMKAGSNSLRVLVGSAMIEFASLLREEEELVIDKAFDVTVICDVEQKFDERSVLEPCADSLLTVEELEASRYVFARCQSIGLPLIVVTRSAAVAASMPPFFFEELASTGHPIAIRLRTAAMDSMSSLWFRTNQPANSEARQELHVKCDRGWFSHSFCGKADLSNLDATSNIWPYITEVRVDESLVILASHTSALESFFEVSVVEGSLASHLLINGPEGIIHVQQPFECIIRKA